MNEDLNVTPSKCNEDSQVSFNMHYNPCSLFLLTSMSPTSACAMSFTFCTSVFTFSAAWVHRHLSEHLVHLCWCHCQLLLLHHQLLGQLSREETSSTRAAWYHCYHDWKVGLGMRLSKKKLVHWSTCALLRYGRCKCYTLWWLTNCNNWAIKDSLGMYVHVWHGWRFVRFSIYTANYVFSIFHRVIHSVFVRADHYINARLAQLTG